MFVGRFFMIVPAMAIAARWRPRRSIPPSAGTFPTTGGLFVGLVVGVILIIGGLTFFPALALGPDRRAPRDECRQPPCSDRSLFGVRPWTRPWKP
jgi:K+-transporting ATPase A subunit